MAGNFGRVICHDPSTLATGDIDEYQFFSLFPRVKASESADGSGMGN